MIDEILLMAPASHTLHWYPAITNAKDIPRPTRTIELTQRSYKENTSASGKECSKFSAVDEFTVQKSILGGILLVQKKQLFCKVNFFQQV